MATESHGPTVALAGSGSVLHAGAQRVTDVAADELIEVSVYLRPRTSPGFALDALPFEARRAALVARRTADHADDIRLLQEFAAAHGLSVSAVEPAQRLVKLSGSASQMQVAFGTNLGIYRDGTECFRGHDGLIRIPQNLEPVVQAILGLDTRRAAEPHFVGADIVTAHLPTEVGKLHNFPTSVNGAGQCIAIIELGNRCGYFERDIDTAFSDMGLTRPRVESISVSGGSNNPGWSFSMTVTGAGAGRGNRIQLTVNDASQVRSNDTVVVSGLTGMGVADGECQIAVVDNTHIELQGTVFTNPYTGGGTALDVTNDDAEVALDIQVAGGIAPGALQVVYFAPNTHKGFADAVHAAVYDGANNPSVISISWGQMEEAWGNDRQVMDAALADAALLNVSVFVASGDDNSGDKGTDGLGHVDYPASSPWAIGCGGTLIDTTGNTITSEVVWNDGASGTGGGISRVYPTQLFQLHASLPPNFNTDVAGRGVPDVAGNASPASGYKVVLSTPSLGLDRQRSANGGTSAVAPLWAGLAALINEATSERIGFFLPALNENPSLVRVR
jgi:subtilase family serine protease